MNLLEHAAILIGRRKFEDFARANPELPDDALAVANTLDTHSTRCAAAMIAGSLAHAADNLLKGTETIDLVAVHVLVILCGLCIIWVRHAISKHDVRINAAVQQARAATGIASVSKTLVVALGFAVFIAAHGAFAIGTNDPSLVTTNNPTTPISQLPLTLLTVIEKSTVVSSGVGVNLHGTVDPLLSQQLTLIGFGNTNAAWQAGLAHATFFIPAKNEEQLGVSANWQLWHIPFLSKLLLLNLSEVNGSAYLGEPIELYTTGVKGFDWKRTTAGASLGWKF